MRHINFFLFIKGTLFWLGITCYYLFWQPGVKGCLEAGAAGVRTLEPQIPMLP